MIVLTAAGNAVMGIGILFHLLRPPLLPEDLRFLALSASQLDIIRPRLELWLAHVFIVLGGYAVATGVSTIALAATSFRAHSPDAAVGALIGGAASIGLMAAVSFSIDSVLKWVLLGRACNLIVFWLETRNEVSALTSESPPASRRVLSSDAPSASRRDGQDAQFGSLYMTIA
jgi:hypothetical protein